MSTSTTTTTATTTSFSRFFSGNTNRTTPALPSYLLSDQSALPSSSTSSSGYLLSAVASGNMERAETNSTNTEIMDFVGRYHTLQGYQNASDSLIKDLLIYCEELQSSYGQENRRLKHELSNAKLDLEHATFSRRDMQQMLSALESEISFIKNRNPYVLILIDGDGLLFQETFIKQGVEGGKQAAYALRSAVAEYVGSLAGEVEIIAKVCANMSGLAKAMRRDGCLDDESSLKEFSLGFTQAKASFDFIDVGYGKERADSKIKEATRWHLRNHNCRQILLGISHDAGYAPFLDEILQDKDTRSRVSIVEGTATVRELKNTSVHILDPIPSLFRNQKLVDRSGDRAAEATYLKSAMVAAVNKTAISSPPLAVSSPASASSTLAPASWAGVTAKASPPPQITTPLANMVNKSTIPYRQAAQAKPQTPTWSPGPRGLDPPIPISQAALENIKKRTGSSKLCNNHYLRGPCAKSDECCFEHRYRPTNDEVNAIAHLARLNPCTSGQECDVENCIYGHHCPTMQGNVCTHPFCKFRISDHPPGAKFKNTKISEN